MRDPLSCETKLNHIFPSPIHCFLAYFLISLIIKFQRGCKTTKKERADEFNQHPPFIYLSFTDLTEQKRFHKLHVNWPGVRKRRHKPEGCKRNYSKRKWRGKETQFGEKRKNSKRRRKIDCWRQKRHAENKQTNKKKKKTKKTWRPVNSGKRRLGGWLVRKWTVSGNRVPYLRLTIAPKIRQQRFVKTNAKIKGTEMLSNHQKAQMKTLKF